MSLDAATVSELYADASVHALWELSPTRVPYSLGFLDVAVEYLGSPVIESGVPKRIITEIINTQADPIAARCDISLPSGWTAEQRSCRNPGSVSSEERIPPPTV